jgi:hypothetical protein
MMQLAGLTEMDYNGLYGQNTISYLPVNAFESSRVHLVHSVHFVHHAGDQRLQPSSE